MLDASCTLQSLKAARDQQLHDLIRATIDAGDPGILVIGRKGLFDPVPEAAMKRKAIINDPVLEVRYPIFRHRGSGRVHFSLYMPLKAVINEDASHCRLGLAFSELELNRL